MQMDAAIMENSMRISQKTKNSYHMTQQFHSWVYIQKKQTHEFEKIHASQCSLQHYFNC